VKATPDRLRASSTCKCQFIRSRRKRVSTGKEGKRTHHVSAMDTQSYAGEMVAVELLVESVLMILACNAGSGMRNKSGRLSHFFFVSYLRVYIQRP
jgi:hypothetical protein